MIKETFVAIRDLHRLKEISKVLIHFGLKEFAQRLKLPHAAEKVSRLFHSKRSHNEYISSAARMRMALEKLGPTFIKLGQILSTRVDVFPFDWITEFEKLQSNVPPMPEEQLPNVLKAALGEDYANLFASFDMRPVGSGSIAQVHKATLHDGTIVAVKLRRPGISEKIEADLRVLNHLAVLIETEMPDSARYQPVQMVKHFARSLRRELNLETEAHNMDGFAKDFANDPNLVIPKVFWQYTNPLVNVQEFIEGIPASDSEQLSKSNIDTKFLVKIGANAILKMILVNGFFHADPHPGNLFFLDSQRIAFIDFGMVGHLSQTRRNEIIELMLALVEHDERGMMDVLTGWSVNQSLDESRFANDIAQMMFSYAHVPLKDLNLTALISDTMSLIREHYILLPPEMSMLIKTLITLEGLGRQLDPQFQLIEQITPFVRELIFNRYNPKQIWKQGRHSFTQMLTMLSGLPRDLTRVSKDMRNGRFRINLDLARLDHFGAQLDKSANRLTMGIVTGCLIIGSSIVMMVNAGPKLFGLPVFGFLGFMLSMFSSIWILWSIWRSSKKH